MADVTLTFESDIKRVEANNAKLVKQNAALTESLRTVKTVSKEATDAWASGLEKIKAGNDVWAKGLKGLAGSSAPFRRELDTWKLSFAGVKKEADFLTGGMNMLLSATTKYIGPLAVIGAGLGIAKTAASLLRAEYALFRSELEQSAQGHQDFQSRLVRDIAISRDALRGDEVEKFVGSVPGAKPEEVRASLAGVTAEMPSADLSRRKSVAAAVSRLAPTGQDLGQVGQLAGQLGDIMPGTKGEDVADRAALLIREAGGDIGKVGADKMQRSIRQLIARGKSPDEATALALSAAQGKISPETLTAMAQGGQLSREQRMEMKRLTPEVMRDNLAMVQSADSQDVIGGIVGGMEKTAAGRGALARHAGESQKERRTREQARQEELFQQYDDLIRARHAGDDMLTHGAVEGVIAMSKFGRTVNAGASTDQLARQNEGIERLIQILRKNAEATEALARQKGAMNVDRHQE